MKRFATALLACATTLPAAADGMKFLTLTTHRLERHFEHGDFALEFDARYGGNHSAWLFRGEGTKADGHDAEAEIQLLYARPLSAYFDWELGVEASLHDGESTPGIVIGLNGEAPYRIHSDARLTLNDHGDLFLHAEFERDFLLTQRIVLQPRLGFRVGDHDDDAAVELRLRYEFSRKFAPYVGISWERIFGPDESSATSAVAGLSFWF